MRKILVLALIGLLLPLWGVAQTPSQPTAGSTSGEVKLKIVKHDLPVCVVTGRNIGGKKFEIVYTEGNVEHHVFVIDRFAAKRFFKNPALYMAKIQHMEGSQTTK